MSETSRDVRPAPGAGEGSLPRAPEPSIAARLRRILIGGPRRLDERGLFHRVSLVALLAWVGLGADGLSSSAYGPEEAFRTLGTHGALAVVLAAITAATVFIISAGYSRIIEAFPHGGGGYVVATKLIGPRTGLVSGAALLVDYVLTITVSVAAAGDALFSFLPAGWAAWRHPAEAAAIIGLTVLNIRGVRESVLTLAPVFFVFIATHAVLIVGAIAAKAPRLGEEARAVAGGFSHAHAALGLGGLALLLMHAFSLGGGTYTGIEAVSNGVPIMRPPQVRTAKRTMLLMASSLAFTAAGLLLCYLLWGVTPVEGKTMNAVLVERVAGGLPGGAAIVIITLVSEGALLLVAAQAGFTDGPRVLANMAVDSWAPRRFAALSDRLTAQNGIALMGAAALGALIYTRGDVRHLVVMYSINVFLTFSLSLGAMLRRSWRRPRAERRPSDIAVFAAGFLLCAVILGVTVFEKFGEGGWITLAVTGALIAACFAVRATYARMARKVEAAFGPLERGLRAPTARPRPIDPSLPTAAILVGGFGGLGVHTTLNLVRAFPGHFKNILFLSVGVIDSGRFKGDQAIDELRAETESMLARYVEFASGLGIPAASHAAIGADPIAEAEALCLRVARSYPRITFVAGHLVFQRDTWFRRWLFNQTAYTIQRRLQWFGLNMIILPARIDDLAAIARSA